MKIFSIYRFSIFDLLRRVSLAIAAMFVTTAVLADDVSAEQALQIARQFAQSPQTQQLSRRSAPAKPVAPTMAHVMRSKESQRDNVYVINLGNDQGFVIVSAEDGADDVVLGYCDHGSFDYDDCPIQLKDLLGSYSASVDTLRSHPVMAAPRRVVTAWPSYIGSIVVGPLLTTTWNQSWPYNMYCPKGCPTGCYPTALAQVMNYWKWPKKTVGDDEYFSNQTYDWDNMLDDYWGYNNVQAEAVAKLMADIGKAFGTAYAPEGSPTYFESQALVKFFGYEPDIKQVRGLIASDLMGSMKSELNEHRPVLYCGAPGYESTDIPHALVCDGYTDRDYFHFNYGWGGSCDGFYKNALVNRYAYNAYIFTGVRPYNAEYKVIDGIKYGLLTNGTAEVIDYTVGGTGYRENGEVTIPSVVTNEGKEYRVTRIRSLAFYSKGKFDKITIGDNVETIDRNAFIMSTVTEVVFGDKAKEIPDNAFENAGVNKLTIGASIKRIGKRAFRMCSVGEITCKSPAFEVDDEAFYGPLGNGLDTGEWLSHITKIGRRAFAMKFFLNNPNFENLEEIGSEAFYTCIFKTNDGRGDALFAIPPKLKSIAPDAFKNSVGLWWFYVRDNPYFYNTGSAQPYLLNSSGTSLLMTVTDPFDLIGDPNGLYPLPETLVKLEPGSICGNYGANIVIPNTIVEMEGAFKNCSKSITDVYIRADYPPVISDSTFNEEIFKNSNLRLYVPKGSRERYAKAPGWRRFKSILEAYKWAKYYPDDYEPTPPPGRQYTMVVNGTDDDSQQRVSIPISDVNSMELSDDGRQVVIKRRGGKDDVTTSVVSVDSITWKPSFVFENAEVFDLNDSTLTVEAQKCRVTFSSTCIDEDVQLSIRNGVLTPDVTDGITRGISLDLNLSDGTHELSGTADITIPVQPNAGEKVNAAYYNEEEGCWEPICFKYDEASGTLTITTNHLSMYSVFFIKDEHSCLAKLNYWGFAPELYEIDDAIKKLLYIVSSDDPEAQMVREYKDEMSLWQSVGLDGLYNIATSISEPLLDFKPEALDNAVNIMGYLGTAISILDVVGADINGDNVGVLKGTLSTVLNYAGGQMAAAIGTPIMAACSGCVAFIGIALEKLNTRVQEHKRDMFRAAYRYYYSQRGYNAIGGHSSYKADKNNPHGYYRTTKDWYNYLYPIFAEGKMSQSKLEAFIEYAVQRYCDRFWEDNEDIRIECYEWAKVQGLSSLMWISEADKQQICDEYYADLINGEMVSVIQAIKENLRYEASQRYKKTLEKVGAIVNTQYKLQISDSSKPSDGKSKFAGWQMRFAEIPSSVGNAEEWMCTIGDDGTATLGYFTVYALLQNEMPFKVVLVDRKGIERKTWDFQISEHTGKRGFKIDLAKSGVEVEAPKLIDLQLTYDPDHVEMPMTFDGIYYHLDTENNLVKKPMQNIQEWNIYLDNRFNKRARFQYELEKFFKRHDFITVDDAGHVKIGDDIIGTMTGNEGTGTFTINTTHKFVEKTKAEFVQSFNKAFSTGSGWDIAYGISNLLNGTIKHKIDCEFHLVRNDAGSYTVTFTGSGTFDFSGENVILIENLDWSAWTKENQSITVDDVSTGITEAEGKVTLRYVVTLE